MIHALANSRAGHRLLRALEAVGVMLTVAIAVPGQAQANPWIHGDGGVYCLDGTVPGAYNTTRHMPNGIAYVHECVNYSYNSPGTILYSQSALVIYYHAYWSGATDVFSGKSMDVQVGLGVTTSTLCPARAWHDGDVYTCFSGTWPYTRPKGLEASFYGKGIVVDYAGGEHPLWSPIVP
jgi:hypothetical protein